MKFLNKTSLTVALIFLLQTSAQNTADKWSKQILAHEQPTAEDWVPIRNGKMISFERDLVPAAQQQLQFFAEPLNNRFSHLGQPQSNTSPFQFFNQPPQSQAKTRTIQNFGGPFGQKAPVAESLIQNPSNQFQFMQEIRNSPNVVHFQSQPIPKSLQGFPPQQQQLNFPSRPGSPPQFQKLPPPQFQPVQTPPPNFQPIPHQNEQPPPQQGQQVDENGNPVQLLYVPFESLYPQQNGPRPGSSDNRFNNILNQPVSAALINDFYSQNEVQEIQPKPIATTRRPSPAPVTSSFKTTNPFESNLKPKPHQPPLSMFVKLSGPRATESEVLKELQNSNSIDVMDTYTKNSPNVFIGPSGMEAPEGYSKFDLPYLSSIDSTRSERKIEQLPFFVAPLSYKTPPGFSKIPLPAPHVGSVVVNQPNSLDTEVAGVTQDNFFTNRPSPTTVQQFGPTESKQRVVSLNSGFKLSSNGNVELLRNEFTFPTLPPTRPSPAFDSQRSAFTTPRPSFSPSTAAETPLTKVAYKEIEEKRNYGHSTLTNPSTTRAPVTQRTKSENYYASSPRSTATRPPAKTTPFTELKTVQEEYFSYDNSKRPISQFSFGTEVENPTHNFDFRPIPNFNFGEADFATSKPKTKATTSIFNFPSSTPAPKPSFSFSPTVSVIENTDAYGNVNGGSDGNSFEFRSTYRPTQDYSNANRFNFGTEKTYTQPPKYTNDNNENTVDDSVATTDNPNFSLPSDLPEISPQLPESSTTPATTTTTTTRRPATRGSRRPVSSSARSTESPSTTGERTRPTAVRRRPTTFPARNSVSPTEASFPSRSTAVSRGTKVRYNATSDEKTKFRTRGRGGSKGGEEDNIEYQRDVLNQNYPSSIRPLGIEPVTERFIEIQPNIVDAYKVESAEVAAESPSVNDYNAPLENVEVIPLGGKAKTQYENSINDNTPNYSPLYYENTIDTTTPVVTTTTTTTPPPPPPPPTFPSNHKYSSDRDQEQQSGVVKRLKNVSTANKLRGNFNYNKNRNIEPIHHTRDSTTTQQSDIEDDETLIAVPTTAAPVATTTAAPTTVETTQSTVPRRTSFPRRRLTYTTTEAAPAASDDSSRTRGNGRKENVVVVKRVRGRTRASTTTTEQPETTRRSAAIRTRAPYTRSSGRDTNRERASDSNASNEEVKPRFRIRENTGRFRLETQESQWSSRFNQNSFQPVNEKGKEIEIDDDQEIVTVDPEIEKDSYLVNVSASVVPNKEETAKKIEETAGEFEKFVENIMKDIETEPKPAESAKSAEKKTTVVEKKTPRRVLKRIHKHKSEGIEQAETQNVGKKIVNSVGDNEKFGLSRRIITTTVKPEEETTQIINTTTESIVDEPKGMFDEARKALTALFSTPEDQEDAVNMEEADEKLEESLQDSSTTTSVPITTEEPTTTTAEVTTQKPQKKSAVVSSSKKVQTSTSQKVTGEICYRGRCIKTDEK